MPTNTLWKGGSLPVWNLTPALLWRLLVSPWVNLAAGCDLQRNFPLSKYSSIEIISTPLLNELKKWNTLMLCDTCKALVWRRSRPHRLCIFVSYQSQIELNAQQLKKKIFLFLSIWMAEAFFVVLWRAGSTAPFYLYSILICSKPSRILCTSFRTSSSVKM